MVDLAPGIALASLAFAFFLLFVFWFWFRRRRRHAIRAAQQAKAAVRLQAKQQQQKQQQFISSGSGEEKQAVAGGAAGAAAAAAAATAETVPPEMESEEQARVAWRQRHRHLTAGRLLRWSMVAFAAAVVGVSIWGLVQSITATNGLVPSAWDIVHNVEALVRPRKSGANSLLLPVLSPSHADDRISRSLFTLCLTFATSSLKSFHLSGPPTD